MLKPTRGDALSLGLSHSYFFVMREKSPVKYAYISKLADTLSDALTAYNKEMEEVIEENIKMYYWLEERRLVSRFSAYLFDKGLYDSPKSFRVGAQAVLFKADSVFHKHATFIKFKSIIELHDDFKGGRI